MALLILFGFVAGAATALSPCVLPVLPIALSAGATGGRRRPLGIVAGLAVSFTFATVALVYVISALGLPERPPAQAGDRRPARLRDHADDPAAGGPAGGLDQPVREPGRRRPHASGDGFWSGTAIGASLGLVYAPCAGPILAGVITVSASQSFSAGRLAVALSYGIGSAVVLYFLMLGGRRVVRAAGPPRRRPADRDGRGDGRRRPGDAAATTTSASRTGSPATCRASSSTPAKSWRTPRRRAIGAGRHPRRCRARDRRPGGRARRRRRPPRAAPIRACRCSAWRRNSSATSAGSTPPATGR